MRASERKEEDDGQVSVTAFGQPEGRSPFRCRTGDDGHVWTRSGRTF